MYACREWISNGSGYRSFQQALDRADGDHFPVLRRELSSAKGGQTAPDAARKALEEIAFFRSLDNLGRGALLVDVASGQELFEHNAAYEGVFIWAGKTGLEVGLGEFHLFVRDKKRDATLFRSGRFTQQVLGENDGEHQVELQDLDSVASVVLPFAIKGRMIPWPDGRMEDDQGRCRFDIPAEFRVEVRPVVPSRFEPILAALERVFRAAVETGNPVRWC